MGIPDTQALQASLNANGAQGYLAKLYMSSVVYNKKTDAELTAKETGSTMEQSYLSYTTQTQIIPVIAANVAVRDGFSTYKFNLNTDAPVSNIFISIRKVGGLATTGADISSQVPIVKHSLRLNNKPFHEELPGNIMSYLSDTKAGGGVVLNRTNVLSTSSDASVTGKRHLHLPWCEEPWDRSRNSGTLSFIALGGPEVILYTNVDIAAGGVSYEIVVVHEAHSMLMLYGKNGVVEQNLMR